MEFTTKENRKKMWDKKSLYLDTFHIMFERFFHCSIEENEDVFLWQRTAGGKVLGHVIV